MEDYGLQTNKNRIEYQNYKNPKTWLSKNSYKVRI